MNTQIENISGNNGNNELDGATIKHWMRELRIDRSLGLGRRSRKVRGSSRPHNMTSQTTRTTPVAQVDLDAFIPGTNVTWRDGMAMRKDYDRDNRLFGRTVYTGLSAEDVDFTPAASEMPSIPEGCSADDVIPGTGGWTYGEALEMSLDAMSTARRRH